MWRLPECVYIGLPDEQLDVSSLGYRNAKKKVSNPLPGVARRERPIADFDLPIAMLRCGPSDRPFAATAKSATAGFTQSGQGMHNLAAFCSEVERPIRSQSYFCSSSLLLSVCRHEFNLNVHGRRATHRFRAA